MEVTQLLRGVHSDEGLPGRVKQHATSTWKVAGASVACSVAASVTA